MSRSPPAAMPKAMLWLAGLTAAVCWAGLALQLRLVIVAAAELGAGVAAAILAYASFFTIQTVLMAALITSRAAIGMDERWPSARFKAAIAVYVAVAGLVFAVVLRPLFQHSGLQLWTDVVLHYAVPPLYGLFWFLTVPKQDLRWRDAAIWLIYPLCYLVGVLAYGLWSRFFPYPFFDLPKIGPAALVMAVAGL
ncbi:MAG: Pr6Pr family membrane protein, partial [Pseudolabrys sp.]|nr:Pr6Pr family membrane protein [Pseudolabrys sp.]